MPSQLRCRFRAHDASFERVGDRKRPKQGEPGLGGAAAFKPGDGCRVGEIDLTSAARPLAQLAQLIDTRPFGASLRTFDMRAGPP
jgi:hypothetical protein